MRATSWNWSTRSDAGNPTAGEGTRARLWAGAGVIVLLALVVAVSEGVRVTLPRHPGSTPAWGERLGRLDEAIKMRSVSRAAYEWRDAYSEALRSRSWETLLVAGERADRIDGLLVRPGAFRAEARRAYLVALFRARAEGSTAGVLAAADAFQRLGDAEVASAARRILGESPSAR